MGDKVFKWDCALCVQPKPTKYIVQMYNHIMDYYKRLPNSDTFKMILVQTSQPLSLAP